MRSHTLFGSDRSWSRPKKTNNLSRSQINYPALHNKDQGPIFRLGMRHTVYSFVSPRADTFDYKIEINLTHHCCFISKQLLCGQLSVCLSVQLFLCQHRILRLVQLGFFFCCFFLVCVWMIIFFILLCICQSKEDRDVIVNLL